jgi:sulfite exporter TauE/SafE
LVYSMLALASLAGGPGDGALVMFAFGAGTLPSLFAAGLAASRLRALARSTLLRRSAAAIYITLGAWLAFTALAGAHHPHDAAAAADDTCPPRLVEL